MSNNIVGSGLTFPLGIDAQGGFSLAVGQGELEQAIGIILGTAVGERVMRPKFGCRVHELLYAPNNQQTAAMAERFVADALAMWEPRITVHSVTAKPDYSHDGRILIEIRFLIKATNDERSLVYPFYTIPEEE